MEGHSMEYKNSFLSRLFGTKPEEAAKQTLSAPIPPEEPAPPPLERRFATGLSSPGSIRSFS